MTERSLEDLDREIAKLSSKLDELGRLRKEVASYRYEEKMVEEVLRKYTLYDLSFYRASMIAGDDRILMLCRSSRPDQSHRNPLADNQIAVGRPTEVAIRQLARSLRAFEVERDNAEEENR